MKEYSVRFKVEGVKAKNGSEWFMPFSMLRKGIYKSVSDAEYAANFKCEEFKKSGQIVKEYKIIFREVSEWKDL